MSCSYFILSQSDLPNELRDANRWVLWRHEGGKKPPIAPDGRKINLLDSTGWLTFDEALAALQTANADGIGFVLGDGFGGIDLDHCLDDCGKLCQWAKGLMRLLPPTYTEVSPSGCGVKLFFRTSANLNKRKGAVELYTSGRYFTVTSQKLPEAPTELATVPEETIKILAQHLHVFDLAAQIESGEYGEEVVALFKGDICGYPSHSEADLALISYINQRCGLDDPDELDFVFRLSGLYREKWDEVHSSDGRTYGQITITNALSDSNVEGTI